MPDLSLYEAYEISRIRDFNYESGASILLTYVANDDKLAEISNYYENANDAEGVPIGYGYKTNLVTTAANTFLTVRIPDTLIFSVRWCRSSEIQPVPMFWTAKARQFLGEPYASLDLSAPVDFKIWVRHLSRINQVVNAMRIGEDPASIVIPGGTFQPSAEDLRLAYIIIREGEYFQFKRPVLKRTRVIPVGLNDVQTSVVGPTQLYSLDGIANLFGLPDDIYDRVSTVYDDLPAAQPDSKWAWALRQDDSESVVASGKVVENLDFVFSQHETVNSEFIE